MKTTIFGQKCLLQDPVTKKFLVMQRSDYAKDGGLRDIIGGQVNFGENAIDALRREAQEETKLQLGACKTIDIHSRLFTEEKWFIFSLWYCDDFTGNIVLSEEHVIVKRLTIEEFLCLPMRDTVEYVKPVIARYFSR